MRLADQNGDLVVTILGSLGIDVVNFTPLAARYAG